MLWGRASHRIRLWLPLNAFNLFWGMQFTRSFTPCLSIDFSLISVARGKTSCKATPPLLRLRFALQIECKSNAKIIIFVIASTIYCAWQFVEFASVSEASIHFLDSAISQNLIKNPCEAPENSPASWCKKSDSSEQ